MEQADHRQLAKSLDLYHIEESAPGMVFWHPRGYRVYRLLEDLIRRRMRRLGYQEVRTPQLLPRSLWEASGHWEKFGEHMFVVPREEGRDLALKPMSCPCHVQIFNDDVRSWRDLPMRYAEFGQCHRDEPSGSMHGLMRTRAFEQDDAHVLCEESQVAGEVARFAALLRGVYGDLGFHEIEVAISLRPERRAGSDEDWDRAEAQLLEAAQAAGLSPDRLPGEGAFYGPKLEFALRDRQGRSWQCGTVQLDMVLPGRLGARYVDRCGERRTPVMIHHAVLGSMGRFIGILLEESEGRLPFWLAPDQIAVVPISEEQRPAAAAFKDALVAEDLRPILLDQSETFSRRLVMARERKIPVVAIFGAREVESGQVAIKEGGQQISLDIIQALEMLSSRHPPR